MSALTAAKPGAGSLLRGLSWDEYRAIEATNHSTLKVIDESPKHYRENLANPSETDTLRLGIAAHCAVLEPTRFIRDFAIWDRRGESGNLCPRRGQHWDAFVAESGGKTILTEDQHTEALTMQLAVSASAEAMEYLSYGDPEVTLLWTQNLRACKGRVDWITDLGSGPVLVGLKTAADIRLEPFSRAAGRLLYYSQWAFYFDAYQAITGVRPAEVVEIVVEKTPPYDVLVYLIGDDTLQVGRKKYLELLHKLDECERTNRWPGVGGGGKQIFSLPSYMYDDEIYA